MHSFVRSFVRWWLRVDKCDVLGFCKASLNGMVSNYSTRICLVTVIYLWTIFDPSTLCDAKQKVINSWQVHSKKQETCIKSNEARQELRGMRRTGIEPVKVALIHHLPSLFASRKDALMYWDLMSTWNRIQMVYRFCGTI